MIRAILTCEVSVGGVARAFGGVGRLEMTSCKLNTVWNTESLEVCLQTRIVLGCGVLSARQKFEIVECGVLSEGVAVASAGGGVGPRWRHGCGVESQL